MTFSRSDIRDAGAVLTAPASDDLIAITDVSDTASQDWSGLEGTDKVITYDNFKVDILGGYPNVTHTTTTRTLTAADNQQYIRFTNVATATITIPHTLAVGSRGLLLASSTGTAGITVNPTGFTTVDGAISAGKGFSIFWMVYAAGVLTLRGGEGTTEGSYLIASNNLSELANKATARSNLQVDIAGTAATLVDDHNTDTTDVHGIADTSALLDTGDIGSVVQGYSVLIPLVQDYTNATSTTQVRPTTSGKVIWVNTNGSNNPTNAIAGDLTLKPTV